MPAPSEPPLIVTAHVDDDLFAELDALRRRYFPPELNRIPAHISLFHNLPGEHVASILRDLDDACRAMKSIDLEPAAPMFLGRGVALAYRSDDLTRLHGRLAQSWKAWLTPQDRQPFKAHVTIQNKVDRDSARALFEEMGALPTPVGRVDGISVWRYLSGPWESIKTCRFDQS